jgi:hypothetical protein
MVKAASPHATKQTNNREVRLERLLGRQVLAANNQALGRLEEVRVEQQGNRYVVIEYVIGALGLFERLGIGVKLLFGGRGSGYTARWDQLDISDPEHPRLTCTIQELRRL